MNKFIVSTEALKPVLAKLKNAVDSKPVIPVLSQIHCSVTDGILTMITSNLSMSIQHTVEVEAKSNFSFLLSYDRLSKIVALNPRSPLAFAVDGSVTITGPDDNYVIHQEDDISIFPKLPTLPKANNLALQNDVVDTLLLATETCNTDVLNKFNNVLFELAPGKITIASTNGSYYVFSKEFDAPEQNQTEEILIPQKMIQVIKDNLVNKLLYHKKTIAIDCGNMIVYCKRSEEKYANFRAVFPPEWPANLSAKRTDLLSAINKCSVCADSLKTIELVLQEDSISFSSFDTVGEATVTKSCSYTGSVNSIKLNFEYFKKLLQQISYDDINLHIHQSSRPVVMSTPEDAGYLSMIMPLN
jgi:DNA polymerase III sliding clamp (beta) subunit (PCNA family)